MQDITLWYLKQIDLFKGLDQKELEFISSCFSNKRYSKDDEIRGLHQQDTIFLLKEGVIELFAISEDGKKTIIDILGKGSIFGNLPESEQFDFSARVKKSCVLCSMSTKKFFELVSRYPSVSEKLLRFLYTNVLHQKERISSLAVETVPQRLFRLLKTISKETFLKQDIAFTHEELAQMIGTSRQTVTTLINSLIKSGKLTKQGKKYVLSDL